MVKKRESVAVKNGTVTTWQVANGMYLIELVERNPKFYLELVKHETIPTILRNRINACLNYLNIKKPKPDKKR